MLRRAAHSREGGARRNSSIWIEGCQCSRHAGSGVCGIHAEDADRIYDALKRTDIEFVGDLADRDYGCRDFRVRDDNGNMPIVGHDLPNQDESTGKGDPA